MGVTGTHGIPLLPVTNSYKMLYNGARRLGYKRVANDRHAINSKLRDGRPRCRQLGFCGQGCKMLAKWSTSYTETPAAQETGRLDLRSRCMALSIEQGPDGRATGVLYADFDGRQQRQKAALVIVAANAVKTPRLLLNSASGGSPQGLGNGSGLFGRFYTKHMNGSLFGLFGTRIHDKMGDIFFQFRII